VNSTSTGVVLCEDSRSLADWIRAITNNISALLNHMVCMLESYKFLYYYVYVIPRSKKDVTQMFKLYVICLMHLQCISYSEFYVLNFKSHLLINF
jgi:hypothetical protein